jgi:hypothetical protein
MYPGLHIRSLAYRLFDRPTHILGVSGLGQETDVSNTWIQLWANLFRQIGEQNKRQVVHTVFEGISQIHCRQSSNDTRSAILRRFQPS